MREETHLMVSRMFLADPIRSKGPGSVTLVVMHAMPEIARDSDRSTPATLGCGKDGSFF